MGRSIAVMNTKGGVGKSTLVMAMAETLSAHHGRNVLVIDSDSQTSMSIMLMEMDRWEQAERQKLTLVDYLSRAVLTDQEADWKPHVVTGVSDVEEARTVYLMPSHMQLSLFERMISGEHKHAELRTLVRNFLADAKRYFDVILIDCPPGLSVLTETWLRECDYFMPPVKPDYLSVRGLEILKRFRAESDTHGFAELLGVIVNLKDGRIQAEEHWHQQLLADPDNKCFNTVVPRRAYLQRAADFDPGMRTYIAKYPGDAGTSIVSLVSEMLDRIQAAEIEKAAAATTASVTQPTRETIVTPAPVENTIIQDTPIQNIEPVAQPEHVILTETDIPPVTPMSPPPAIDTRVIEPAVLQNAPRDPWNETIEASPAQKASPPPPPAPRPPEQDYQPTTHVRRYGAAPQVPPQRVPGPDDHMPQAPDPNLVAGTPQQPRPPVRHNRK